MTTDPAVEVDGAEIREVALPLRSPYRSGTTAITERRVLLLRVSVGGHEGWGEASPVPGYSVETLAGCRAWLENRFRPVESPADTPPAPPAAAAAVSAALADAAARRAGLPLHRFLGATRDEIPIGAVVGLEPGVGELGILAADLASEGYRRIKLKVSREQGPERVDAVRSALPDHDLAADANGTLDPSDPAGATAFLPFSLSFLEQPYPAGDLEAHAQLRDVGIPVCLDESIAGPSDAARVAETGAADVVNVKPSRVGGLEAALEVRAALGTGVRTWVGGMLETGIGKAAALALAATEGMTAHPADLPPSARHFGIDLVSPAWAMVDGHIRLPDSPGIGVEPDLDAIEAHTVSVTRFGEAVGWRP